MGNPAEFFIAGSMCELPTYMMKLGSRWKGDGNSCCCRASGGLGSPGPGTSRTPDVRPLTLIERLKRYRIIKLNRLTASNSQ